jgi:O-antigen/teichoic acid export membrane protein
MSLTSAAETTPHRDGWLHRLQVQIAAIFEDDERARAQRDALFAFAVRAVSAGLLYLSQVVLARWMGGYEYGIYVSVWTLVLVLGGVSHAGLNLGVIRLIPTYRETGALADLRGLVRGARLLAMAGGTLLALAGLAGVHLFASSLDDHYVLPAYLAMICLPLFALSDVQDGIGRGRAWMGTALLPPYVLRPLLLLSAMCGAHLAGLPATAVTAASAAILATWGAAIVQVLLVNAHMRQEVEPGPRRYDVRTWLVTSAPLLMLAACELTLQNADILIVSRYLSPAEVGIYFAAAKTMALVLFVHYAVGSAVANRFSALDARGDREGLRRFVKDAVNWTFWPSLAGASCILVAGYPLLWLFGEQFTAGYPVMFVLVLGFLARAAMGPAELLLNMLGEQSWSAGVMAVTALLDIALNFTLVPMFGLLGAAAATATALFCAAVMNWIVARRRLGLDIGIWQNLG